MCEQCSAAAEEWGHDPFIPGFYLCRATRDGMWMKAGDWGIVECNDPAFIFQTTPTKDPEAGMSDEQIEALPKEAWVKFDEFVAVSVKIAEEMAESLTGEFSLDVYGRFFTAMCKAGFNPDTDGRASMWLCNRLACFIEDNPNPRKYSGP
jgi:hypothetical protein